MKWLSVIKMVDYTWMAIMGLTALLVAFYFAQPSSGDDIIHAFDGNEVGQPAEGVEVHGSWEIEVRNSDGSLAKKVEFENALVGAYVIGKVLTGLETPGTWSMVFGSSKSDNPPDPCSVDGQRFWCQVEEPELTIIATEVGLELSATTMVEFDDSEIDFVSTALRTCSLNDSSVRSPLSPIECAASDTLAHSFTEKTLGEPIAVTLGQQITLNVAITFSTPAGE